MCLVKLSVDLFHDLLGVGSYWHGSIPVQLLSQEVAFQHPDLAECIFKRNVSTHDQVKVVDVNACAEPLDCEPVLKRQNAQS